MYNIYNIYTASLHQALGGCPGMTGKAGACQNVAELYLEVSNLPCTCPLRILKG